MTTVGRRVVFRFSLRTIILAKGYWIAWLSGLGTRDAVSGRRLVEWEMARCQQEEEEGDEAAVPFVVVMTAWPGTEWFFFFFFSFLGRGHFRWLGIGTVR